VAPEWETAETDFEEVPIAPIVEEDDGLPPMAVGTRLGDYEILEFISRGGTSDRFVALQRSIDRRVGSRMLLAGFS